MTATYKVRTLLWAALCQCLFERRPVTLLPRPYNGRPAQPINPSTSNRTC